MHGLFNQNKINSMLTINKAVTFVGEWEKANEVVAQENSGSRSLVKIWKPPDPGWVKMNSDAALFGDHLVGLGGIVRDYVGQRM